MSINPQILIANPVTLLSAVTATGASATFALPTRSVYIGWQTSYDVNPDAVNITLRVSLDGIKWTVLDTTTVVAGEFRTVGPTAARFVDVNVVTNTGGHQITVQLIAKTAQ